MLIVLLMACKGSDGDSANSGLGSVADPGPGQYEVDEIEADARCLRTISGAPSETEPLFDSRSQFIIEQVGAGYTWTPVNDGPIYWERYTPITLTKREDGAWWGHIAKATEIDAIDPAIPIFVSLFVTIWPTDQWQMRAEIQASVISSSLNADGTLGAEGDVSCSWVHALTASREG